MAGPNTLETGEGNRALNRFARGRGITQSIPPHRSYRNLPLDRRALLATIPALVIIELLTVFCAQRATDAMSAFGTFVAVKEHIVTRPFADPFLFLTLHPMTFEVRHADWLELLLVIGICSILLLVLSLWTAIAALFLFLAGHVNYDSAAFSQLMLRTAILTWFVIPVFVGFFASLFPFRFIERAGFMALTVAWDVPLSIVRYGCFVAILGRTGAIAMTDLYFVFGPLLDIIPVVCFLSILLVRLARSLEARRAAWGLS